jgi:hypothetical protein
VSLCIVDKALKKIYNSEQVPYGCKTWSLILREEHRLRVFENRLLRRIFGPKRDEITGGWRKLHNEKLHNLNNQINEDEMGKPCSKNKAKRNVYRVLVGKPEGKRPLERPRRR